MNSLLLAAEIVSAVTVLIGGFIGIRKMMKWCRHITEGERCHLRSDMLRTYYRHKEDKCIRQYELENFIKLYEAYKALGGNSFIDEVHREVMGFEIES